DQFSQNPAWRESPISLFAIQVDRIDHLEAALGRKLVDELLSLCATRLRRATDAAGTLIAIDRAEFGLLCGADSSPDPPFLVHELLSHCASRIRGATDAADTLIAILRAEFGLLCGSD